MKDAHNLAEDGNLENEKLALIAGQHYRLLGSPNHLSSRIEPASAISRLSAVGLVQRSPSIGYICDENWSRLTADLFACPLRLVAQDSGLSVRRQRFESFRGCFCLGQATVRKVDSSIFGVGPQRSDCSHFVSNSHGQQHCREFSLHG